MQDSRPRKRQSPSNNISETSKKKGRSISVHTESMVSLESFDYSQVPRNRIGYMTTMRACAAMMTALEGHHEKSPMIPEPRFYNPPDDSLDEDKLSILEEKVSSMEEKIKMVSRRACECLASQKILIERINELETSMRQSREINLITRLLDVIPSEKDLEILEKMKEKEAKRLEINREIKNIELQNKILSKTLGRAEAIITDTPVIKKQKRVVIVEEEPMYAKKSLGRGESGRKHTSAKDERNFVRYKGIPKVLHGPYLDDDEEPKTVERKSKFARIRGDEEEAYRKLLPSMDIRKVYKQTEIEIVVTDLDELGDNDNDVEEQTNLDEEDNVDEEENMIDVQEGPEASEDTGQRVEVGEETEVAGGETEVAGGETEVAGGETDQGNRQ